jgi:hypothetical protein
MKKLLALVLCVMMFVSVVPTVAFAGGAAVDNPLYNAAQYNKQIKNMIKHTKTNVENAYKALVADEVVYTSAKTMDDTIVSLVNGIADPLIEKDKYTKAQADAVKDNLRSYFDKTVAKKISDNLYKAYDKDGNRDDLKYAQIVAQAMTDAMTDKDFVAGYQAVATYFALASIVSDIQDNLNDARDDFLDTVDGKFQADFAKKYTTLVDDYIDTVATGAAKAANNNTAYAILSAYVAAADTAYAADMKFIETQNKAVKDAAKTTYNTTVKAAKETDEYTVKVNDEEVKGTLEEFAEDLEIAELELQLVEMDPNATAWEIREAAEAVAEATKAYASAQAQCEKKIAAAKKTYDADVEEADDIADILAYLADYSYSESLEEPYEDYYASLEEINPWALSTEGAWTDFGIRVGSPWA